jgi:hypothetical protein
MPLRKPHAGESQRDFMSYCMDELGDRPHDQKLAICLRQWRGEKSDDDDKATPTVRLPRFGEAYDHYMDNCMDQLDDGRRSERERRSVCERQWRERNLSPRKELAELLVKAAEYVRGVRT